MNRIFALILYIAIVMSSSIFAKSETVNGETGMTKIFDTNGEKSFPAVLYDNVAAQALLKRLPAKFSFSRGSRDFCGPIGEKLPYNKADVHRGYKNGDLVYWLPGDDFVIFTEREDSSSEVDGCVTLGQITGNLDDIRNLGPGLEILLIPAGNVKK